MDNRTPCLTCIHALDIDSNCVRCEFIKDTLFDNCGICGGNFVIIQEIGCKRYETKTVNDKTGVMHNGQ